MEDVQVLQKDEVVKFRGEGTAIEQRAAALQVVDENTRAEASDMRERARQFKQAVVVRFKEPKEAADKAHRAICALEKEMYGPADRVIKVLDGKSSAYMMEQERIRRAQEEKLRKEAEAKEQAERERLMRLAEKQMDKGNLAKAEETLARAEEVFIPAPTVVGVDRTVKVDAGSTNARPDFDVVVDDPRLVLAEVVAGRLPINAIEIKTNVLKNHVKMVMVGNNFPRIPGVKLVPKYTFSGRAAAAHTN